MWIYALVHVIISPYSFEHWALCVLENGLQLSNAERSVLAGVLPASVILAYHATNALGKKHFAYGSDANRTVLK